MTKTNPLLKRPSAASGPAQESPRADVVNRPRTQLELFLLGWACDFWPDEPGKQHPVDAVMERWGDWEFERKCLSAIFRRICRKNPRWLIGVATDFPDQVLALSPWIKSVEMPWGPVPGRLTWREWVEAAAVSFDARSASAPSPPTFVPDPSVLTVNVTPATTRRAKGRQVNKAGLWAEGASDEK